MVTAARFPAALGASVFIHLLLLTALSVSGILPNQPRLSEIEINYYRAKSKSVSIEKKLPKEITQKDLDKVAPGQRIILSQENKIPEKNLPVSEIDQKELFLESKNFFQKPSPPKLDFLAKNTITLSPVEIESPDKVSQNPAYLTYGNYLRERIRRCLYSRFSHSSDKGVVCLKFTLGADGTLLEYHIIGEKSDCSDKLKQIAIDGIKDAAPFPGLPKELNSRQATYSIFIHFINLENE